MHGFPRAGRAVQRDFLKSSPASPRKTPSFLTLLLGFSFYFKQVFLNFQNINSMRSRNQSSSKLEWIYMYSPFLNPKIESLSNTYVHICANMEMHNFVSTHSFLGWGALGKQINELNYESQTYKALYFKQVTLLLFMHNSYCTPEFPNCGNVV